MYCGHMMKTTTFVSSSNIYYHMINDHWTNIYFGLLCMLSFKVTIISLEIVKCMIYTYLHLISLITSKYQNVIPSIYYALVNVSKNPRYTFIHPHNIVLQYLSLHHRVAFSRSTIKKNKLNHAPYSSI